MTSEKYIIGLRVKDSTCNEHMTIAFLGESKISPTQEEVNQLGKISAKIIGDAFFGPNKDVHVWLIELSSSKDEIVSMWKKYNVEQEHTKGLTEPTLHVSIKNDSPKREIGDIIEFSSIFAKRVGGGTDFYFEKNL